ncbi:hypothetical protein BW450_19850 [Salmonella enterica]|nr:hypothetical protein [Salmonella enterica]
MLMIVNAHVVQKENAVQIHPYKETRESLVYNKTVDLMQLLVDIQKLLKKHAEAQEQSVQIRNGLVYKIQENTFNNQNKCLEKQRSAMGYQITSGVVGGVFSSLTAMAPGMGAMKGNRFAKAGTCLGAIGGVGGIVPGIVDGLKTQNVDVEVNRLKYLEQYQSGNFKQASEDLQSDNRKIFERYSEIKSSSRELFDIIKKLGDAVSLR